MSRQYLSAVESAKLIRQSLKEAFPGVKFGVRSDNNSVNVSWIDGPNVKQVDAVINRFKGGYFDGMIDYAGSRYAKMDGNDVQFGSKYLFTSRKFSNSMLGIVLPRVAEYWGVDLPADAIERYNKGDLYGIGADRFLGQQDGFRQQVWRALSAHSFVLKVQDSATAARVKFSGDDGYGQGTVGQNGKGGEAAYRGIQEAQQRQAAIKAFEDNPQMFSQAVQ